MKPSRTKLTSCFSVLVVALTGTLCGQVLRPVDTSNRIDLASLKLPSFSIFGLPLSGDPIESGDLVEQSRLDDFLHKVNAERAKDGLKEGDYLWIVPMILYKSRGLFYKDSWTSEEVKQGQMITRFLGRLADKPDLIIIEPDQDSFGKGLARLRDWFVSLCRDNRTLASMIFTLDSGPFFGEEIAVNRVRAMRLIGSVAIPKQRARFVLMTDETQPEPMVVGVINSDNSVRWLKRLRGTPKARIANAALAERKMVTQEGYGFVLRLIADWSSKGQRCSLYLDESLRLRFYYLSW